MPWSTQQQALKHIKAEPSLNVLVKEFLAPFDGNIKPGQIILQYYTRLFMKAMQIRVREMRARNWRCKLQARKNSLNRTRSLTPSFRYVGFFYTRCLGNPLFAPQMPVVFVVSVVSVMSAYPALSPLVCGCLSCLRRFRYFRDVIPVIFMKATKVANHRFGKP